MADDVRRQWSCQSDLLDLEGDLDKLGKRNSLRSEDGDRLSAMILEEAEREQQAVDALARGLVEELINDCVKFH